MYHTPNDQISLIKQGVFQELGENLGILTRNILQGNYEKIENNIDNDPLIYFDIFGRYLIVYKRSTSKIIQQILIVLSIIISIILILIDKIFHSQKLSRCVNCNCIYFYFKYSFILRILSILIYFLSNIISIILAFIFSISTALIISKTRPLSWYGNSTLTIFLFSFPCFIGFIVITYLTNIFHNFILKKWPKNGSRLKNNCIKMNFNIEQNFSIILIYIFLMLISIYFNNRIFYIILIWSIFICPMYLILNVIEYLIHQNLLKERFSYLFIPMLICLFPLIHTIEIMNRLVRIFIPFMTRDFSDGLSFGKNIFICNIILILSLFFILILIPILHRIKQFRRLLIILLFIFSILLIIIYNRQSFTRNHPKTFYAKHTSKSVYTGIKLKNLSFIVLLVSQLSSIRLSTYDNLPLSNVLDQFSAKSGYILHNKRCSMRPTICRFDDTFNRTFPIENIEIKSMNNLVNYTILIRHVLSYNIQISSRSSVKFIVQNQFIFPRTLTIIDIIINSTLTIFDIDIKIRRCDVNDSPFLLLFNRLMTNLILMGGGQCRAIDDDTNLIIDLNTLSK